ncbi:efflux RND transporter periplasmic adaptor subunit [Paraburkholderia fungorum]|jgi:membrane fusion protein, multidrug efflux system|uniref:Membrane fusion protein (Multidrug efflux system) n=1 Tax=Paraburkholderia fungorum TaxID=134537 RepID=A0AAW3UQR8_9BURK|nr:efflux RND transporter periplasmic adaptor subunit [Paraburkholderia fungorum]MBB4512140.1 membrane fusion protein (multidrug efflux system) [Paraburkholderia fungorum]MBB6200046.1 membrane fusion protein (multidrug efflux system) [Paraburkholderia fungorum]PZR44501.1 MAG: efflux transporter periplasmic adaptor subunit [Paraburkholderia fungorum]QLD53650.1 efflux transporter periplasmic adaptor subunit [Paraburkholderia fungorum]
MTERKPMTKRMVIMLICVGLLLAALVGFNQFRSYMIGKFMASNAAPPSTVSAIVAGYQSWQPQLAAVGSLRAVRGVDVTTEVAGLVREVAFRSGQEAKAGQVLVRLNADSDVALLQSLQAAAELAQTVYTRDKAQYDIKAIAKAQLDADAADLKGKKAQVAQQAALVDKKTIRAPFAGRLGITTINPGQYLNPGDAIVTLQAIDPIYADFYLPQQQLGQLAIGQTIVVDTNAYSGQTFTGKIQSMNPRVDSATRNIQIEATVDNRERKLLPGMYANVKIDAGTAQRYLTLPQTAITYNPYGATVFIVKQGAQPNAQGKALPVAQQVFVTPGPTRGDQVAILKGVEAGMQVVTSGQLKLKNGTPLIINNSVQPADNPNPAPQEQ